MTHAARDIECTREGLMQMARDYLGTVDPAVPYASPIHGDLRNLPPILCLVGSEEVLVDDTLRLARAVADAGGSATASIWAGMQHVFPIWVGAFPEAQRAMDLVGHWVGAILDDR
jgi:monoterpene epsilon-lactone hydrolase